MVRIIKIVCPICRITHPKGIITCGKARRFLEDKKREKRLRILEKKKRNNLKQSQIKGRILPIDNALR